jgi:transposase
VLHALCDAHHLRELKALIDIEKEDWARKMQGLLRCACHLANLAREREITIKTRLAERLERRYDAILAGGLAFHDAQSPLAPTTVKEGRQRRGRKPRRTAVVGSCYRVGRAEGPNPGVSRQGWSQRKVTS